MGTEVTKRFCVPTACFAARCAQRRSRPAVAEWVVTISALPGRALTVASTARTFEGRGEGSRCRRQDVIRDRAMNDECGTHRITLYSVGPESPYPDSSCTGEERPRIDGTHLRERVVS